MYRDTDELENILPESSTRLVNLNTRIPKFLSDRIDLSVGILQTQHIYHKVSKQTAVQILLEKGYEAVLSEFEGMDREEDTGEKEVVIIERETKPQIKDRTSFDVEAYAQMANKTYYEPRKVSNTNNDIEYDSRVHRLQQKLGLR